MIDLVTIRANMKKAMDSNRLPKAYTGDFGLDLDLLRAVADDCTHAVWLLRDCGTVLVPLNLGIDPVYITYWLWGNHDQTVKAYLLHLEIGLVEPITFDRAESLVNRPPAHIQATDSSEAIYQAVNDVLERGCRLRVWGVFNPPESVESIGGWQAWQAYFSNSGNRLMADFMGKAIRFTSNRAAA
jgi:hypothetical protein